VSEINRNSVRIEIGIGVRNEPEQSANISEAQSAVSKRDFSNKMMIALKEANETQYWLKLLNEANGSSQKLQILIIECEEIIKILRSINLSIKKSL
jgi:four helix bundle protein